MFRNSTQSPEPAPRDSEHPNRSQNWYTTAMMRTFFVLGLLLTSSCTLLFDPAGSKDDADAGLLKDAGTADAAVLPPSPPCASLAPLQTDFAKEIPSLWSIYSDSDSTIEHSSSVAEFSVFQAPNRFATLQSKFAHETRGQALTIQFGVIPQQLQVDFTLFSLATDGAVNNVTLSYLDGLVGINVNGASVGSSIPAPKDSSYWQISHETKLIGDLEVTNIVFRMGKTLESLSTLREVSSFGDYDPSYANVEISVRNNNYSPKVLKLKRVFTGVPTVDYCPISTFVAPFTPKK